MQKKKGFKKFFLPQKDPKELVRKWQSSLRSETRAAERQIRDIQRAQKKIEQSARDAAKRNDMTSARILAKELVQSRRTVTQLHANKAHILSMQVALSEQLAVIKVSGTIQQSTQIMESISSLIKLPEMMKISQNLAMEMEKAGLIEEVVSDAFESAIDEDGLEEETEAEVNKVLDELAAEIRILPAARRSVVAAPQPAVEDIETEEVDEDDLRNRLAAIKS